MIGELRKLFGEYSGLVEKLYKQAKEQDDIKTMNDLRRVWERLQQGPIRAMVVGVSSAGKSTMLNALAGNIIVPEGSHTTSPVPVWIYSDGEAQFSPDVRIFKTKGENTLPSARNNNIGIYPFITDYCYTPIEAARGTAKDKYKDVTAASVNVNVETRRIYQSGVTFVDTPGIGVAIGDNIRVDDVISGGCEFALVVFRNMTQETRDFLRSQFVEKNAPLGHILKNGRVFAVHNYTHAGTDADARTHMESIFGRQLKDGLFMINALYARQGNADFYDYKGLLPPSSRNDLAKEVNDSMRSERDAIAQVEAREDLQMLRDESNAEMDRLWAAFESGVSRILEKPEELLVPICSSINECFTRPSGEYFDSELKEQLNDLNGRSFELVKEAHTHNKVRMAKEADYSKRLEIIKYLFDDNFISQFSHDAYNGLISVACDSFVKSDEFQKHRPLADTEAGAWAVAERHIESRTDCIELMYNVILRRLEKMNDLLIEHISNEYFGAPHNVSYSAMIRSLFDIVRDNIEKIEQPLTAEIPWYGEGDIAENLLPLMTNREPTEEDLLYKAIYANENTSGMPWYDKELIKICKAAHAEAMIAIREMAPLVMEEPLIEEIKAFLLKKQGVVERGGLRGAWAKNGIGIDLDYDYFAPFIKDGKGCTGGNKGIANCLKKYCAVYYDSFSEGFREKITQKLYADLIEKYEQEMEQYEAELDEICEEMVLKA